MRLSFYWVSVFRHSLFVIRGIISPLIWALPKMRVESVVKNYLKWIDFFY